MGRRGKGRFGEREGGGLEALGDGPVQGGGGTELNISANRLNSEEAHEVTLGHKRPIQQEHHHQEGHHHHGVDKTTPLFKIKN